MQIACRSLVVVALALAACGDDGSGGSTSDADNTTEDSMTPTGSATAPSSTTNDESTTSGMASSSDEGESDSGSDSGGSGSGSGSGSADSGSSGGALSFETDIYPLLTMERPRPLSGEIAACNGCHGTGAGGLATPNAETAYTNLIDMPSSSKLCAGLSYVVAGDPDNSCFVIFYEMRLRDSLGWVDQAETDLVRAWVEGGAAF